MTGPEGFDFQPFDDDGQPDLGAPELEMLDEAALRLIIYRTKQREIREERAAAAAAQAASEIANANPALDRLRSGPTSGRLGQPQTLSRNRDQASSSRREPGEPWRRW